MRTSCKLSTILLIFCLSAGTARACTIGIANAGATSDGRPLQFKNRDSSQALQNLRFFAASPPETPYAYLGVGTGNTATMGVNSEGLVSGNSAARAEGQGWDELYNNSAMQRYILPRFATVDEVEAFLNRQMGYNPPGEEDFIISANLPFIDRTGEAILYEMYKPDPAVDSPDNAFLHVYDTTNPNRVAQGLAGLVFRSGHFHYKADGTDDLSAKPTYETAYHNVTGLRNIGQLNVETVIQGDDGAQGYEVIRYGPGRALPPIPDAFVPDSFSVSAIAVQGVKPDEDPALTTLWAVLGNANYSMAVPAWVRMGDRVADPMRNGDLSDRSFSLRDKGNETTVQASIFPAETHLFNMVNNILLPHWREYGVPSPEEMGRVHQQMAADAYSLLDCLDNVRGNNKAPVIGPVSVNASADPQMQFSVTAHDPDGSIVSYEWNFGDGRTSTNTAPEHLYRNAGTYLVSCTVTDNEGVSITSWDYVTVEVQLTQIPYQQDFESLPEGAGPADFGWLAGPEDVSSVVAKMYSYDGEFPLPESARTKVLEFKTGGSALTVEFPVSESEFSDLYLDQMAYLSPMLNNPPSAVNDPDVKTAWYMNEEGSLVLFHGGADGDTGTFTVLDGRFTPWTWRRVTVVVDMDTAAPIPFFQFLVDGEAQAGASEGFSAPTLQHGNYTGGTWFRFANYSAQAAEGNDRKLLAAEIRGSGMIDDFVLTDTNPEPPPRKTYLVRPGAGSGGSADPSGEVMVKSGDYLSVVYTADPFFSIGSLYSNDDAVSEASGAETFEWTALNVSGNITNQAVFAAEIWSGDGRTPLWWADARGYSDGSALSLYEGWLIHQENLDLPFRLIDIGVNEEQKAFVKWQCSGPAFGTVSVLSAADLQTGTWDELAGQTVYDQGVSTWISSEAVSSSAFFRVRIQSEE